MKPPSLTVAAIVRDEEATLPAMLASARFADEIVVLDTGSRDRTPEVATMLGARVASTEWVDDFSVARNQLLDLIETKYCLMVDADERIVAESVPPFLAELTEQNPDCGSVTIESETSDGSVLERVGRLCLTDGRYRYTGRIHEQLVGPHRPMPLSLRLTHSGYRSEVMLKKSKAARNLRLLEQERTSHPGDPYLDYQVGRNRWLLERSPLAVTELARAWSRCARDAPYAVAIVRELVYALRALGRGTEAVGLLDDAERTLGAVADLTFARGLLALDRGDLAGTVGAFQRCLELGEHVGASTVRGVGSFRAMVNLGVVAELTGQVAQAEDWYRRALACEPRFTPAEEGLRRLSMAR